MVPVMDTSKRNVYIDYQYISGNENYSFEFKIYRNNAGIKNKIKTVCKRLSEIAVLQGTTTILVVGNVVGAEEKEHIEKEYNIFIWDIENILCILEEFPHLKSEFISLLSFNILDIVAKKQKR